MSNRTETATLRDLERVLKAAADPTRTRILKLLETGSLCVCQVQAVLGLAPSTISKHLGVLKVAGLVVDRRDGKWISYALEAPSRLPHARPVLDLLRGAIDQDPVVVADRERLAEIRAIPVAELCALPASKVPVPAVRVRRESR